VKLPRALRNTLARLLRSLPVKGRWRIAAPLTRLFPADPATVSLRGVGRMTLDLGVEMQQQLYWAGVGRDDVRLDRVVRAALPPDGVFVDVGANVGIHALAAARRLEAGGGAVLAFEPHPANYQALLQNVRLNGWRHVNAEHLGLADAPAVLTGRASAGGGNWSLASRGDYRFEVRLVRLDDYLADNPLPRLDVLKVDVEGAEVRVLRGARRALQRFRPLIIFEACPAWLAKMGSSPEELFAELHDYGYTIRRLPARQLAWGPQLEASDLAGLGADGWTNLAAVPRDAAPMGTAPDPLAAEAR
jgi:FkbM family methyltransferase